MTRSRLFPVLVSTSLMALAGCTAEAPAPALSKAPAPTGAAAVWHLKPDQKLQRSSTKFTALVARLACNSGVTGQVLAPEIRLTEAEVVVTFSVTPSQSGGRCPTNERLAYEVDLGEPLQDRAIVDGRCLPGREAAGTAECVSGPTRFKP